MVYPALLPLMRYTSAASSRLNWRSRADLNGLVRFAGRRNLVSVRAPSHFNWPLLSAHHHHKHEGLDSLIRSVSRITTVLANVSSVFQLFSFLVVCSDMISKGFGCVAFFASVIASSVCIHLSCLVCIQSVVHWMHTRQDRRIHLRLQNLPLPAHADMSYFYSTRK